MPRRSSSLQRTDVALQGMIDSLVRMSRAARSVHRRLRRVASLRWPSRSVAKPGSTANVSTRCASPRCCTTSATSPCRASILAKPAPLTETELALMRTHVDEGCQLLAEIDFGAPIADIVYQSHERYRRQRLSARPEGRGDPARSAHPRDRRYGRSDVLAASVSSRGRHGSGHRRDQSRRRPTLRSAPGRGLHAAGAPARLHAAGVSAMRDARSRMSPLKSFRVIAPP